MQCIALLDLIHPDASAVDADHALGEQQLQLVGLLSCVKLGVATPGACAFRPACLMSHKWLHTPACKLSNEMND